MFTWFEILEIMLYWFQLLGISIACYMGELIILALVVSGCFHRNEVFVFYILVYL